MSTKQIACWSIAVWIVSSVTLARSIDAPLANAAEAMDQQLISTLLKASTDINAPQADGMTALHWITLHDDLETATLLVQFGANANATNRYGITPLTLACTNGNSALVELFLGAGADPNTTLPGGETALMTASRTGRIGPVRALLAHGANPHAVVRGMGRQDVVGVNYFLIRMADPTTFNFEINAEQTALMWAAAEGHAAVVKELIKAGAEFQNALSSGFTPLLLAVREGHFEVVQTLLEAGVNINESIRPLPDWLHITNDARLRPGARPLHVAVENGQFELASYLLEEGAEANVDDLTGYTPLHAMVAARRVPPGDENPPPEPSGNMTSLELVNKLVLHGADLDAVLWKTLPMYNDPAAVGKPKLKTTPFLMASQTTDIELMKVLAALGANPQLTNENGSTALMLVGKKIGTQKEVLEAMQILLDLGVDINAVNHDGETVMHFSAYKDRPAIIKFLAHKGARIEVWNQKNKYGATPLAIAAGYRRHGAPQPKAEAAIREVMLAAGVAPPRKITTDAAQAH